LSPNLPKIGSLSGYLGMINALENLFPWLADGLRRISAFSREGKIRRSDPSGGIGLIRETAGICHNLHYQF
jgi:hypothetical protein